MVRVFTTLQPLVGSKMFSSALFTPRTVACVGAQRLMAASLPSSRVQPTSPYKVQARYFSKVATGVEEAQTLIEREYFSKVRKRLESDPRKKITYQEFVDVCSSEGLNQEQAKQLSQSLSDAGSILYFGSSSNAVLRDSIFLKPIEFNNTVSRIVAEMSDDTYLREKLAKKQEELVKLKAELQPLQSQRDALERRAARRATTIIWAGLGYCVVQAAIVARLTWWELSWDVMEPVTYMLTFGTALIGYSFFVLTGSEYTYEGLRKTLEVRRLNKLIRRTGFDEGAYQKLQQAILVREHEIQKLLIDIENDPVTLHLKDPAKPIV